MPEIITGRYVMKFGDDGLLIYAVVDDVVVE